MIAAFALLLLCQLCGELVIRFYPMPIPGPVIGMVALLVFLTLKGRVPHSLRQTSGGLLSHLALLFVPAGTGIVLHLQRVEEEWLPLGLALIFSTLITIIVSAFMFQLLSRRMGLKEERGDGS